MSPAVIDAIGLAAAILTTLCWIPQAARTIRTRDTRAISLVTQAAFTAGIGLWLVYGVLLGSLPLILANGVSFVLVATILALKLRFG
ncbi:MAG TPA: SemiSWEET transporter [Salinarimonas sp.]|nr:SemiSWEET transporter [Salinarimonas sp.]